LVGSVGADRLVGDAGDDRIWGNADNDRLYDDEGNDHLNGGGEIDECYDSVASNAIINCER
jgi:Ca2+-binding RTX toxin-like protein